jgi:hypothetical protein
MMKTQTVHRYLGGMALCFALSIGHAQTSVIPQIADGGGWQTTLVLTNTAANAASASLSFYQETSGGATQAWNLSFVEGVAAQSLTVPGGGTLFLHTPGAGAVTSVGWAQLQAPASVVGYAIFTQRTRGQPDQDGTAPAGASASRILVPFDNSAGFVTSVAVVNPTGSGESISVNIGIDAGAVSQASLPALPALGHTAFALSQQFPATAGHRGLAEFYASNGSLSIIALRFNPTGAFTAAPVYTQSGPPVIGGGGGALPQFSSISVTGTFSPASQASLRVGVTVLIPVPGGYSSGAVGGSTTALLQAPPIIGLAAVWNSVAVSGQTLTFNGLQVGATSVVIDNLGTPHGISSGSLTLTLSPDTASNATGTVTGSMTLVSAVGTLSGPVTGGYVAQQ